MPSVGQGPQGLLQRLCDQTISFFVVVQLFEQRGGFLPVQASQQMRAEIGHRSFLPYETVHEWLINPPALPGESLEIVVRRKCGVIGSGLYNCMKMLL